MLSTLTLQSLPLPTFLCLTIIVSHHRQHAPTNWSCTPTDRFSTLVTSSKLQKTSKFIQFGDVVEVAAFPNSFQKRCRKRSTNERLFPLSSISFYFKAQNAFFLYANDLKKQIINHPDYHHQDSNATNRLPSFGDSLVLIFRQICVVSLHSTPSLSPIPARTAQLLPVRFAISASQSHAIIHYSLPLPSSFLVCTSSSS